MLLAYHFGYDKHGDREILDLQLVTQARPNQPQHGSLSVSRKCAAYKGHFQKKNNKVIIMKVKQSLLPADYMTVYILCGYIIIAKFSVFRNVCLSSSVKF